MTDLSRDALAVLTLALGIGANTATATGGLGGALTVPTRGMESAAAPRCRRKDKRSPSSRVPGAPYNCVSPEYFSTMRMPLLEGRAFTEADTSASIPVAVVNRTMAERFWLRQEAVGRRFSYKGASGPFVTVVGVARDAKLTDLLDEPRMYFFLPQTQNYKSIHALQLRTAGRADSLAPAVEALVRELDPGLPVYDVMTMEKSLQGAHGFFFFKMGAAIGAALGGLGLLLAVVGVYGTVSFSASRRRHEIGIRMALGAQSHSVLGLVMRQAVVLVASGIGIGILAALARRNADSDQPAGERERLRSVNVCQRCGIAGGRRAGGLLHSCAAGGGGQSHGCLAARIV